MAVALHKKVPHVLSRYDTDFLDFFGVEKSVSYQKKGGRGHARPSFFWYDNDSGHKGPFCMTLPIRKLYCLNNFISPINSRCPKPNSYALLNHVISNKMSNMRKYK